MLCRVMRCNRKTYYNHIQRKKKEKILNQAEFILFAKIKALFRESRHSLGSRQISFNRTMRSYIVIILYIKKNKGIKLKILRNLLKIIFNFLLFLFLTNVPKYNQKALDSNSIKK